MGYKNEVSTYTLIKAVPAKGFDWTGFNAALIKLWGDNLGSRIEAPIHQRTLEEWNAAKGMRQIREVAYQAANYYVSDKCQVVNRIPPSDESKMWDSFEGGHTNIYNDEEKKNDAIQEVANLIKDYTK